MLSSDVVYTGMSANNCHLYLPAMRHAVSVIENSAALLLGDMAVEEDAALADVLYAYVVEAW